MIKEFLFVAPHGGIQTVHIGIFPAYGRYFREKMANSGGGLFRTQIEMEKGELYYHYFLDNDFSRPFHNNAEDLISKSDPMLRSSVTSETEPFCALQFDTGDSFIFPVTPDKWVVRAVSHHSWIETVSLFTAEEEDIPFREVHQYRGRKYWLLTLNPDRDGLPLSFALKVAGNRRRFYLHKDKNFTESPDPTGFFQFPPACPVPVEKSIPAWAAGYQVFPDRFFKSARQTPRDYFQGWGQPPGYYSYFGGDLPGITQKLPYLSRLGIHFLYLNPVFYSKTSHRYDTIDYYQIDPLLGSQSDLEELVREAHGCTIKIILDLPLNHCSVDFFAFKDILEKQQNSAYRDWFHIRRFPVEVKADHDYGSWQGNKDMPEFNLRNPAVRDYLLGAARYWLETVDIDGWRLDACSSLPPDFIRDFLNATGEIKKEAVVVGEFWHNDGSRLFREGGVDGLTNFSFYWRVNVPLFEKAAPALDTIADAVMSLNYRYSHAYTRNSWNFLSNHDLPRLHPRMAENNNFRNAVALLYAVPGNPVVYYGEETGLPGRDDPDNRRCMDWNAVESVENNTSFIDLYRYLNDLRETYKTVFAEGLMAVPYVDKTNRILILERFTDGEVLVFIFNFGGQTVSIDAKTILKKTGMGDPVDPVTQDPIAPVSALEGFNFKILVFKQG